MRKPRLLDLFSCAGGAARGYADAGFEVVGVDIEPQPNYPFEHHVADALRVLDGRDGWDLHEFDAIHASPPCQAYTSARVIHGREHPDLVGPVRDLLNASGRPWVIENVPGAPLRPDLVLCGSMFPGLRDGPYGIIRHRLFEFSDMPIGLVLVPPCAHPPQAVSVFGHGGHVYHGVAQWRRVMGIGWMTRDELAQAIPPAYTEFIGAQLLAQLAPSLPVPSTKKGHADETA